MPGVDLPLEVLEDLLLELWEEDLKGVTVAVMVSVWVQIRAATGDDAPSMVMLTGSEGE